MKPKIIATLRETKEALLMKSRTGSIGLVLTVIWGLLPSAGAIGAGNTDSRLADAAKNQDHALVRNLLKAHADVNGTQPDRTTALMWAAHWGDIETVDLLLQSKADVKLVNRYGVSALSEAAALPNIPIMGKLLKVGADPNTVSQDEESVLMTVARTGNLEAVKLLLDHGADINARDYKEEETPLMFAVAEGHLPVVKLLISKGADVNAVAHTLDLPRRPQPNANNFANRTTGGFTSLMFAARQDYVEIAEALLEAGANPSPADRDGMSALIIAALNGSFETGAVILQHGGDANDGVLWETLEFRNYVGDVDDHLQPEITSKVSAMDFIKMLLDHGADPNKPYNKLRTPNRHNGTQPRPGPNTSALTRAVRANDLPTIQLMIDQMNAKGGKVDPNALLSGLVQAYSGSVGVGKLLFRTVTDKEAGDAISLALNLGADPNGKNATGATSLHLAAQQGADELLKILVDRGGDFIAKTTRGLTPLDFAMGKGGVVRQQPGADEEEEGPKAHQSTVALLQKWMKSGGSN
jgi:ankyrin repeat protein